MTTGRINQVAIFVVAPTFNSQRINACVLKLLLHSNHNNVRNKFLPCLHTSSNNGQAVRHGISSFQIKVIIGLD